MNHQTKQPRNSLLCSLPAVLHGCADSLTPDMCLVYQASGGLVVGLVGCRPPGLLSVYIRTVCTQRSTSMRHATY